MQHIIISLVFLVESFISDSALVQLDWSHITETVDDLEVQTVCIDKVIPMLNPLLTNIIFPKMFWSSHFDCVSISSDHVRVPDYRTRGPRFDSLGYQTFWEVLGLEQGPLSLVRTTEELLEWKSGGSGSRKPRLQPWGSIALTTQTLYPQKLALTSLTSGSRSVGIVRLRTKATEFSFVFHPVRWRIYVLWPKNTF
jgi:hypothetical protein